MVSVIVILDIFKIPKLIYVLNVAYLAEFYQIWTLVTVPVPSMHLLTLMVYVPVKRDIYRVSPTKSA